MTPAELHAKYADFHIYDSTGYRTMTLLTHRRCGCLVTDPDAHEKVCFDPPVQMDYDPAKQKFINYQLGEKYS